jgi:mannose/fructose/N-acetylgalactosamine-specific phosphotransferase system component IIB
MPILLYRVDDRLIHGQVIIGWGRPFGIDYILLVDDLVRESPWEQDLYRMGMPPGMELMFANRAEASVHLPALANDERRGILLVGEITTIADLLGAGLSIPALNLGGIHHKPGRTERLPYLYLTDDELALLRKMEDAGVEVTAQDLPTATPVSLGSLE